MHPDQKYVDALINNDITLLRELYQNCSPAMKMMILQNHGTEADAKDIFHESLMDLFVRVKSQPFTLTCSMCAYLKGICKHKWLDELKKRGQRGVTFSNFVGQDLIGENSFELAEEHYTRQRQLDLLRKKFQELGQSCKALLQLSWSKNAMGRRRSTEEIAASLKVTEDMPGKKSLNAL
jgi:RNA polymerase sigma factor (sigma-70 family)